MSHCRKFRRAGEPLTTLEAVAEILCGNYLMVNGKPQHPGWCGSWHLWVLNGFCGRGMIYRAEITDEWRTRHAAADMELAA